MIYPTALQLKLWGMLALAGLFELSSIPVATGWNVLAGAVLGFALLDLLVNLRQPRISIRREVHTNLPVGAWSTIELIVASDDRYSHSVRVHDHTDPDFTTRDEPEAFTLVPGGGMVLSYQVKPARRGLFHFPGTDLICRSPFRLWQKKWYIPNDTEVKVFPNFREISHYALLATHHHLSQMGIRKLLRRGEGKEFHQLRDYRKGDELQKVDWKATSRHRRLISREYQDERDQQILFLLDCGRRMAHVEEGRRLLDEALNSILLLTYVASRQGDSIGLHAFGGTDKWLPPRKLGDSVRSMLLTMYDIESSPVTADYIKAGQEVTKRQNRRALVVLVTNSRLEDHDDLLHVARQLKRKHLVVIANLKESQLQERSTQEITTFNDAVTHQAMTSYLSERKKLGTLLKHHGIVFLDLTAPQLPTALVNTYLDIKSSGSL